MTCVANMFQPWRDQLGSKNVEMLSQFKAKLLIVDTQALEIDTVAVVCQFGSLKSVPLPAVYYICSLLSMLPISDFPYPMLNRTVIIIIHYLS